jgi:deoxyribose-phosphate aldolase
MSQVISELDEEVRSWRQIAGSIDHTLLKPEARREQIIQLSEEALRYEFAAVCVHPCWTSLAVSILHGTGVKVASTVGFPLGSNHTSVKRLETHEAVRLGAQEVEVMMNIGVLKSGDRKLVQTEMESITALAHDHGAIVKIILETPLLTLEEKILSSQLSLAAKADYVKTASGFWGTTTADDVALLRGVVGHQAGVKASGGIRSAGDVMTMLNAGADRIGTSWGVEMMRELRRIG